MSKGKTIGKVEKVHKKALMDRERFLGNYFELMSLKVAAIIFLLQSCTFQPVDEPPLQLVNNVLIDGQRLEFKAARLNLTGPVTISSEDSHIQAVLELSTDEEFEIPAKPGSSLYRIPIYGKNEGFNLPSFPLQNGTFEVFNEGLLDEMDLSFLNEKNFTSPIQLLMSANNDGEWSSEITGDEGTVQIQFDINNELVSITNNWSSEEGRQISGAVSLLLNLSNFRP